MNDQISILSRSLFYEISYKILCKGESLQMAKINNVRTRDWISKYHDSMSLDSYSFHVDGLITWLSHSLQLFIAENTCHPTFSLFLTDWLIWTQKSKYIPNDLFNKILWPKIQKETFSGFKWKRLFFFLSSDTYFVSKGIMREEFALKYFASNGSMKEWFV